MEEDLIQIGDKVFIIRRESLERDYIRYRVTNSASQTVELVFCSFYQDVANHRKFWTIQLYVNKKSKGYEFGKTTGKTGLESLLIAKECLKQFIGCLNRQSLWNDHLYVWGDDAKRIKAYERGLKDMGFVLTNETWGKKYRSGKCLLKIINRK